MGNDNRQGGREDQTRQQQQQQGQQQSQDQFAQASDKNAQPIGGNDSSTGSGTTMSAGSSTGGAGSSSTGQASYGSGGQSSTQTQSQNRPDKGQDADLGQSPDDQKSGFIGSKNSDDDTGASMTPRGGSDQFGKQSQDPNYQQSSAGDQSYAEQGRGAPEDSESAGDADIETERSQGRETDIEGSSL